VCTVVVLVQVLTAEVLSIPTIALQPSGNPGRSNPVLYAMHPKNSYLYTCGQDLKDGGGCTSAVYMVCVDCAEKSPLCELSPEELAQIVTEAERERQQAEAVGKSMPEADIAGAYRGMLGGW
jgi:hypothetical protein